MTQFFLDTSFLVGLLDRSDPHYKRSHEIYSNIKSQLESKNIFLSDIVVNEIWTVMARRAEQRKVTHEFPQFRLTFTNFIQAIPILRLYEILNKNYKRIIDLMSEYSGRLGFHDALIVLFLSQIPDVTLITFDRDFAAVPNLRILS